MLVGSLAKLGNILFIQGRNYFPIKNLLKLFVVALHVGAVHVRCKRATFPKEVVRAVRRTFIHFSITDKKKCAHD